MMNSHQKMLKVTNEAIKGLRCIIKEIQNKEFKTVKDRAKLINTSDKINYLLGYRRALREFLNFVDDSQEEYMGDMINGIKEKALNIQSEEK